MGKPDNVFLTDTRRRYLNDPDSFTETNRRAHFYRLRDRAQMALDELIEVYESDEIDNSELFAPTDVRRLFGALFTDPDDFTPRGEYDGDSLEWAKEHNYDDALLAELQMAEQTWRLLLLGSITENTDQFEEYLQRLQSDVRGRVEGKRKAEQDE